MFELNAGCVNPDRVELRSLPWPTGRAPLKTSVTAAVCVAFAGALLTPAAEGASETLARVRSNHVLRCGIGENLAGFSDSVQKKIVHDNVTRLYGLN